MATDLVLHPQTRQQISRFAAYPAHALVIMGSPGSGKQTLAELLARQLLGIADDVMAGLHAYPYLHIITPADDKRTIGIEAVRELQHFTSLKLPQTSLRRIIIIQGAHTLTTEAQNALLKLLEEPPANSYFILTASDAKALLPTIRSRTQLFTVNRPAKADLLQHFSAQSHDAKAVEQAYFMSGGLPGLMHAILAEQEHPLKTAAKTARQLLQASQFERLCQVDALSKQREQAMDVLLILRYMAQAAIDQTAAASVVNGGAAAETAIATKRLKQWHRVLQASCDAEQAYAVSAQAKLTLTNLMLQL